MLTNAEEAINVDQSIEKRLVMRIRYCTLECRCCTLYYNVAEAIELGSLNCFEKGVALKDFKTQLAKARDKPSTKSYSNDTDQDPTKTVKLLVTKPNGSALRQPSQGTQTILETSSNQRPIDDHGNKKLFQHCSPETSPNVVSLFMHVEAGNMNQVSRLLSRYPDVINAVDEKLQGGRTALSEAVLRGDLSLARLLLEKGADPNAIATDGKTAMIYAFEHNRDELILLLIQRGARLDVIDENGMSALEYAQPREGNLLVAQAITSFVPTVRNGAQLSQESAHVWDFILTATESYQTAVSTVLDRFSDRLPVLINADSSDNNSYLSLAHPNYVLSLRASLRFLNRYNIQDDEPLHTSDCTIVMLAQDLYEHSRSVVLKFMRYRSQYDNEISLRSIARLEHQYVSPILAHCDGDVDLLFRQDALERDLFPYVITLPAADGSLENMPSSGDDCSLNDFNTVKAAARQIVNALGHLHSKNLLHGDVQPGNILIYDSLYCFTDLDSGYLDETPQITTLTNSFVMQRSWSEAVTPPELLVVDGHDDILGTSTDHRIIVRSVPIDEVRGTPDLEGLKFTPARKEKAHDIWGLGLTLFFLFSGGKHLFRISAEHDGSPKNSELLVIRDWTDKTKQKLLTAVNHPRARDLLMKILERDPAKRPTTSQILSHDFFRELNSASSSPSRSEYMGDGVSRDELQSNMKLLGEASRTITEMSKKMAEYEKSVHAKENEIVELRASLKQLEIELHTARLDNSGLSQGEKGDHDDTQSNIISDLIEQLKAKDDNLSDKDQWINDKDNEIADLMDQLGAKDTEVGIREELLDELQDELASLQVKLADKEREAFEAAEQVADLNEQLSDLQEELAEKARWLADMDTQLADRDERLADLVAQLASSAESSHGDISLVEDMKADITRLGEDLIKRDVEMEKLSKVLIEKDRTCTEANTSLAEVSKKLSEFLKLLEEKDEELRVKECESSANILRIEELISARKSLEEDHEQMVALLTEKEESLANLRTEISNKDKSLQDLNSKVDTLQAELERVRKYANDVEQESGLLVEQKVSVINNLAELFQEKDEALTVMTASITEKEKKIYDLNELLRIKSDELSTCVCESEQFKIRLTEFQKFDSELCTEIDDFRSKVIALESEVAGLNQQKLVAEERLLEEIDKGKRLQEELAEKDAFIVRQDDRMSALETSFRVSYEDLEEENQRLRDCAVDGGSLNEALSRQQRELSLLMEQLRLREEELSERTHMLADRDDQINDLTEQVINKEGTIIQLVDEMSNKDSEVFFRDEKLAEKEYDAAQLQGKVTDLSKKMRGLEEDLEEKSRWLSELSSQIAGKDEKIAELSAQLATAKMSVIASVKPSVTLERENHEKNEQITKLMKQLNESKRRVDDLNAKLERVHGPDNDSKTFRRQLDEKCQEVDRLVKSLEEKERKSNEKSAVVADKNKQLAERMHVIHEKDLLLAENDREISRLKGMLAAAGVNRHMSPSSKDEHTNGTVATGAVSSPSTKGNSENLKKHESDFDRNVAPVSTVNGGEDEGALGSQLEDLEHDLLEKKREFQTLVNELGVLSKVLMAKDKQLAAQSNDIAIRDSQLSYKNMQLAEKQKVILDKDEHIQNMNNELIAKDKIIQEKTLKLMRQETLLEQKTQQLEVQQRKSIGSPTASAKMFCHTPDSHADDAQATSATAVATSSSWEELVAQKDAELASYIEYYTYAYNLVGERDVRIAEVEVAVCAKDSIIAEKDRELNDWMTAYHERDKSLADAIEALALQTQENADKERALEELDIRIANLNEQINSKDEVIIDKENQILVMEQQLLFRDRLLLERDTQLAAVLDQVISPSKDDQDAVSALSEHSIAVKSEKFETPRRHAPSQGTSVLACFQVGARTETVNHMDSQLAHMGMKLAEKDKQLATVLARLLQRNLMLSGYSSIEKKALTEDVAIVGTPSDLYTKDELILKLEKELAVIIEKLVEKDEHIAALTKRLNMDVRSSYLPRHNRTRRTSLRSPNSHDPNPFCVAWPSHVADEAVETPEASLVEKELKTVLAVNKTLEDENRRLQAELQVFWREHFKRRPTRDPDSYDPVGTE